MSALPYNCFIVKIGGDSFLRRWGPCGAMLLLTFLSYVDRSVLAILSPTILHDLHMTAEQYGWAIFAFSMCYAIANPVWGYWMDRAGLFATALLAVGLWSLASGGHALVIGVGSLCVARGMLGFGEGAAFPAGLKTVTETLPESRRSLGLGVAYSGGSLGAAVTPLIVIPLALHFGWRSAFGLTMFAGLMWAVMWIGMRSFVRRRSELRVAAATGRPRWSKALFATVAVYGLGASPLAYGLYAAPLYLTRVLHVSQGELAHLLWVPPAGWEAGYLFWGWIADVRRRRGADKLGIFFAAFCCAGFTVTLLPLAARTTHGVLLTMVLFFVEMFVAGGFIVLALSDGIVRQGREHAGFLAGFCISCWAIATGLVMPVVGKMFDQGKFSATLWLVATLPVVGTAIWWGITLRER